MYLFYRPIIVYLKIENVMKNHSYENKSAFSQFLKHVAKNFVALFESGNKREFQRLKDFITS
jgi:hypothetical protein